MTALSKRKEPSTAEYRRVGPPRESHTGFSDIEAVSTPTSYFRIVQLAYRATAQAVARNSHGAMQKQTN